MTSPLPFVDNRISFRSLAVSGYDAFMSDSSHNPPESVVTSGEGRCQLCGALMATTEKTCLSCGEPRTSAAKPPRRWYQLTLIECLVIALIISLLTALLLPAVQQASSGGPRERCKNNLKQIGLALHRYHEKHGTFPPAYIADANGRPMHSWRVLILPFLGYQELYDEYRLDEPWDGPHNSQLSDRILAEFNCPGSREAKLSPTTMTSYVAVVGPETAWPGDQPVSIGDISDGTANTLLVVEVLNSGIHWMEPRDLHTLQMASTVNAKAGQGISSVHLGGAHVQECDGAVRFIMESTPASQLRALLTRGGSDDAGEF
jgi:type II secretory pathway pseudopilin PulG